MMPLSDYQQAVELYLSCRELRDKDFFGKSDPRVTVYLQTKGQWAHIGQTEMLKDNLNPDFKTTIKAEFIFETKQPLKFEVYDIDESTANDLIGTVETTLGEVMGARKQTLTLQLISKHKKPAGKLTVRGDKIGSARNQIFWQWSGVKLMNTDGLFGKSDPFLRFFKDKAGDWLQVHETEFIKNNLDPIWKTFQIGDDKLCAGDHNKPFRIECWDNQTDGDHRYIGLVDITIEKLKNGENTFQLYNQKKNKNSGTLKLVSFSMKDTPSFVDFIRGGEQLNAIVAVDFTGSNGDPKTSSSLHARFTDGRLNEYQNAITNVCQIILNYDYDQMVPVFGFGGKPHFEGFNSKVASHCFPCTGNVQQSQVLALQGILDVYHYALDHVELSGPTYFAPILTEAVKACEINKQNEADIYTIMLILTDGEIHDMDETIDIIVGAAHLPISVIIIGVGGADFSKMEILDGDKGLADSKGQRSARDFVQFVPFRKYQNDPIALTKHVLAEVPNQLVQYKALVNRKPKQPLY